jgi:formylglycine-generating enzyme required for sulfatase activity
MESPMKMLYPAIFSLAAACAATGGNTSNTGGSPLGGTTSSTGGSSAGGAQVGGSATGGSLPPSCASSGPGLSDCGDGESCCTSIKVHGGTFYRTYKNEGSGATNTADPATISDFRLDKYLVTVGRFRAFVAAWDQGDGYLPAVGSGKHGHLGGGKGLADSGAPGGYEAGWLESYNNKLNMLNDSLECQSGLFTWTRKVEGQEKLPMNCVNWFEAYAFCIWDGGFLPSEAEYVYAAAGGSEQRRFPWGSSDPGKSNEYAIYGCNYPDGSGTCDGTVRNLASVGSAKLGAGRWGHLDLVGNLMEWYLDYFAQSYVSPCTDCAYLADGSGRAPRDGYYGSNEVNLLLSAYRNNGFYPANRFYSSGFRCARTP